MHKKPFVICMLALVLIMGLAACSSLRLPGSASSQSGTTANADTTSAQDQNPQGQAFDMSQQPIEQKLAIGTLKLEGADNAITAEQAKALLPLWKAVKSMSADSNTSIEELNGLYEQIQESMTAAQIQAIQDLSLTPEETQALMQQYGVQMQAPQGAPGNLSEEERATRIAEFRAQGGGQNNGNFQGRRVMEGAGGPPPGDFVEGGQPNMRQTPQANRTPPAGRGNRGFGGGFNMLFVDPLIKVLEQRAGE